MSTQNSKNRLFIHILCILGFIGMVTVNALANALPINGYNTGELSAFYPNLFVPSGITFSIWGLIYLSLIAYLIYQSTVLRKADGVFIEKMGFLFFLTCLANSAWIFAWHYQITLLSLAIMLILLLLLIKITIAINVGIPQGNPSKKWFLHIPFSMYLGWISIATIANVTAVLVDLEWDGAGISEALWAKILIVIGAALALIMLQLRKDIIYSLVVIWAFAGIIIKRTAGGEMLLENISLIAVISIAVILVDILRKWNRIGKIYFS